MTHRGMGLGVPTPALLDGAALFLDFDGTLVELFGTPHGTQVDAALRTLLEALQRRLAGRVAIVSGRTVEVLRGAFGLSDFWLAGSHGLEVAPPGAAIETPPRPAALDALTAALRAFTGDHPGTLLEEKSLGLGLHYRQAPQHEHDATQLMTRLAREAGLVLQRGKMMLELRPPGAHKGSAIAELLRRAPFSGHRPVFFGDDVTDEDGFETVETLGGAGVLVGPERTTHARYRLDDVTAVRALLARATERAAP